MQMKLFMRPRQPGFYYLRQYVAPHQVVFRQSNFLNQERDVKFNAIQLGRMRCDITPQYLSGK